MPVARTQVLPTLMPVIQVPDQNALEAKVVHFEDFDVTASSDTTSAMFLGGLLPWRLINESGGALTFTLRSARALNGTALVPYDQDVGAVRTLLVPDDADIELPTGLAGISWLVVVGSGAGSNITLVCRR